LCFKVKFDISKSLANAKNGALTAGNNGAFRITQQTRNLDSKNNVVIAAKGRNVTTRITLIAPANVNCRRHGNRSAS